MRFAALLLSGALLGLLAAPAAGADAPEGRVFLETSVSSASPHVGERVRITLLAGFDRAFFAEHAVPLFTRPTDLDARILVPWLDGIEGAVLVGDRGAADATASVAVNDDVVEAARAPDRVVDGRTFTVLRFARTFVFGAPGAFTLPPAEVRFAWATRFVDDFVSGRMPVDRREARVASGPVPLTVRPVPEPAPEGYTGAVGRFVVRADAAPRAVDAGEILELTLRIKGEGNLTLFDTPRLGGLDGFHVYGALDDRAAPVRTVVYDLSPLDAGVDAVPAIAFPFFDPAAEEFRTARTDPIPLVVRGPPGDGAAPGSAPRGSPFWLVLAGFVIVVAAAAVVVLAARRRRARARIDPADARALAARTAFETALAAPDAVPADALAAYLAARLDRPPATVIAPGLGDRLVAAGAPPDVAARAAALMEELVAARYGGRTDDRQADAARDLVAELSTVRFAE